MILDEKPLVDEIESDEDVKQERAASRPISSPAAEPAEPAELVMSGVMAFFIKDTPRECWRHPPDAKAAARKAFQVVVRKRLHQEGKKANRYRWRDDGLAVDWVRLPPVVEHEADDDDDIQVLENPAPAPIPTIVLEDSPEPEPRGLEPPSSSSDAKRWSPHSPPVAKRQRLDEPPEWQSTAGGWLDAAEQSRPIASSSPAPSNAALPDERVETSVPPDARQPGSSVRPEAARASSSVPPDALLEIRAQMQALEEEMGARMRALQDQMKAALQHE